MRLHVSTAAVMSMTAASAFGAEPTFSLIAEEFAGGVPWIKTGIPVPLSEDGKVVFPTEALGTFADGLHAYAGGLLTPIPLAAGQDNVNSVALDSAGHVAFVASRQAGTSQFRGVYRTTTSAAPVTTFHEDLQTFDPGPAVRFVAMSENGTVAFSSIVSSSGALYRGPITGAPTVLRGGSGIFFNTQRMDVNDSGTTAVQFEYTSPVGGLSRAILAFDTPGPTLAQTRSAVEQTSVGVQPMPSINDSGRIAFSLNSTIQMRFYDPPNNAAGTLLETITLTPGVYVTDPVAVGIGPRTYTQVASNAGGFDTFDRVVINDAGRVLFEATLDGGGFGIFAGGDPEADALVRFGDELQPGRNLTVIELGDLNNADQFTFLTSYFGGDRQVWLAAVPEPSAAALLLVPLLALRRLKGQRRPPSATDDEMP